MKQTLSPIIHKDQYTDLIERDLLEYLKEVIFDPLFEEARAVSYTHLTLPTILRV